MSEHLSLSHLNDLLLLAWMFAALTVAYKPRVHPLWCAGSFALCLLAGFASILAQEVWCPNFGVYMLLFVLWGCAYGATVLKGSFLWKTAMAAVYGCTTFHLGKVVGLVNSWLPLTWQRLDWVGYVLFQGFALLSALFLARHAVTTERKVPAVCWGSLMSVSLIGVGFAYYQMVNDRGLNRLGSAALHSLGMIAIVLIVQQLCANVIHSHERHMVRLSIEQGSEGTAEMAKQVSRTEEVLRRYRHETINHLSTLAALLEDGETQRAQALVADMLGAPGAPASDTNSGNPLVDAIFRQKAEVCRERGVALSSDLVLTDRLPLSDAELSSLMSNLLNNAIEAAGKCPKPWIRVRIYPARDYLCMEVSNSADDASLRSNPALHTTKEQPDLHGIGLQVVREIAQRHQGMVFFDIDQPGQFTVRALLHL